MKRLALIFLVLASPALAGDVGAPSSFWSPTWTEFALSNGTKTIVTIHADGTVTLGEGVTPDEASKAFWDELQRDGMRLACGGAPR